METFFLYHSKSVIKVLVMLNKYISLLALPVDKQAHGLQIMFPAVLNTRSLGTQVAGIANRQRTCLPKLEKLCSLAFHHSSGHLRGRRFITKSTNNYITVHNLKAETQT